MRALKTPPTPTSEPVFVVEEMVMDYVTLRGLENKLGLKKEDIPEYVLHELLDNSLDYIESTLTNPEINVYVTSGTEEKAIRLKVSNTDVKQSFTTEMIKEMFNYHNYSSTKRNQFKIGRGAIGHGLKTVLSATYALATEFYNHTSWTPIKIRNRNKEFTVSLTVDKITGLQPPDVKSMTTEQDIPRTEVEIDIPMDSINVERIRKQLKLCFNNYVILNPHITMNITVDGKSENFPAVQRLKSDWRNLHSIWNYSEKDFEYLISTIRAKATTSLFDAITSPSIALNEAYILVKRPEFNTPLIEAQHDKSLIHTLYEDLKNLKPAKEVLELPYDMRVKPRKDAIKGRLKQLGIKVLNIKYASANWSYKSKSKDVKFPYRFEIAEIKTENSNHKIVSGINSSLIDLDNIHDPDAFKYTKQTWTYGAQNISHILNDECGYSNDPKKNKKPHNIIFMNLVSPRVDYASYAKSQINLKPFGNTIGQNVYDTCKGGKRTARVKGELTQEQICLNFLTDRYNAVQENPSLIVDDRWTPSDIWYGCRPTLLDNGILITKNTRSNFTQKIRRICEEEFNCNMEEIGIFAADRAQMYFNGRWYDVGFDELDTLALFGTDLIIFEKEGMAETLTALSDRLGFAILFTRGFATKYVRDLSELTENGGNVLVLSDYDASGILLASKVNAPRIGIDPDTLHQFRLDRESVEEEYDPGNHLAGIKDFVSQKEFEYLRNKRIEINSIKMSVGTKRFQDWIIQRLGKLYPSRDYTRAIKLEVVLPDELKTQFDSITTKIEDYQKDKRHEIADNLTDVEGFLEVPKEREDANKNLKKVITDDSQYQEFIKKFNELMSHPYMTQL